MQSAVEAAQRSLHATSKVGATLAGDGWAVSSANVWPPLIAKRIGFEARIGNASGTVHAETACLLNAPQATAGAAMFATDPPCPNCVKNMAEAGVAALYIDHKGFEKDFAARRLRDFETLSMEICRRGFISVFKVYRKEKRMEGLYTAPAPRETPLETPFIKIQRSAITPQTQTPFAYAAVIDNRGTVFHMTAEAHAVHGLEETDAMRHEKYSATVQPVAALLMRCAAMGFKIRQQTVFSSRVPTARELVDLTGAGVVKLAIGDLEDSRDTFAKDALKQLQDANILQISTARFCDFQNAD